MTHRNGKKTVGIVGGGQLGRMLALQGARMGIDTRLFQPATTGASEPLLNVHVGALDDREALEAFVRACDVITFENEWADTRTLVSVCEAQGVPLRPSSDALARVANKIDQKRFASSAGLPVGPFASVLSFSALLKAARSFGYPVVLKSPTNGYDGYGTATPKDANELERAYQRLAVDSKVLVERYLPFVRELSVLVARRPNGEQVIYDPVWTRQENHQCVAVEAPAPTSPAVTERARQVAADTVAAFGVVGICAVELFEMEDGTLLLNELAPRPHNSGHYTVEACRTSQFENHLRAVLDWPLGSPEQLVTSAVMVNILGREHRDAQLEGLPDALGVEGASVHIYGKRHSRPARKMGHVTVVGDEVALVRQRAHDAADRVRP